MRVYWNIIISSILVCAAFALTGFVPFGTISPSTYAGAGTFAIIALVIGLLSRQPQVIAQAYTTTHNSHEGWAMAFGTFAVIGLISAVSGLASLKGDGWLAIFLVPAFTYFIFSCVLAIFQLNTYQDEK